MQTPLHLMSEGGINFKFFVLILFCCNFGQGDMIQWRYCMRFHFGGKFNFDGYSLNKISHRPTHLHPILLRSNMTWYKVPQKGWQPVHCASCRGGGDTNPGAAQRPRSPCAAQPPLPSPAAAAAAHGHGLPVAQAHGRHGNGSTTAFVSGSNGAKHRQET